MTERFQGKISKPHCSMLLQLHLLNSVYGLFGLLRLSGTAKPLNWMKPVYELDPLDPENNGFINEDFIVWMRTAALPTFRKLYRIIHKKPGTTLPSGLYTLKITYSILYSPAKTCVIKSQDKALIFF